MTTTTAEAMPSNKHRHGGSRGVNPPFSSLSSISSTTSFYHHQGDDDDEITPIAATTSRRADEERSSRLASSSSITSSTHDRTPSTLAAGPASSPPSSIITTAAVDPPVRRKPLPRHSRLLDRSDAADSEVDSRPSSIDQTQHRGARGGSGGGGTQAEALETSALVLRDLDRFPHGQSPNSPNPQGQQQPGHARISSESVINRKHDSSALTPGAADAPHELRRAATTMSLHPSQRHPQLTLQLDSTNNQNSDSTADTAPNGKPRSPGSKLGSFFGWNKASSPGPGGSPSTPITDNTSSPVSAKSASSPGSSTLNRAQALAIDVSKANHDAGPAAFSDTALSMPLPTPAAAPNGKLDELEEELREISSELASSIRREMDLEDTVERLQAEASNKDAGLTRRTSDYFSDSGTSSTRFPATDTESKEIELEKMQRKTEQDKAQLRVDLSQKVQAERQQRKTLESHCRALEDKIGQVETLQTTSKDASGRVKELEGSLEDMKRRLAEERQVKENFEDLLSALKGEIESYRNERDNLRDEVVPALRARVDGLENDSSEHQKLTYEYSRMAQEIQSLKNENTTLMNARRMQLEIQGHGGRINSIIEEGGDQGSGLMRSNSNRGSGMARRGSLSRSGSVKANESRESLAERVKDIEAQRDALHTALKNLLHRQEHSTRETEKRLKAMESEKERALAESTRRGYNGEVSLLRDEINQLRRRADEALEQKWQCEKGLGGLKMDLDRAEQETSSLRTLLQEHDILVPDGAAKAGGDGEFDLAGQATSASLEQAYKDLRTSRAAAQKRFDASKGTTEEGGLNEEINLGNQLEASAERVEGLASQVSQQLASNNLLRKRLAAAIGRGEKEQHSSASRINELQGKLKTLEDDLMDAQQHSEDMVNTHEIELREIRESHNVQLMRVGGRATMSGLSPKSPLSPLIAGKSPRLDLTTSGQNKSMSEASNTEALQKRVTELEKALSDADKEMQEVVGRMNLAQIEVMDLQSERDEAMRLTRKLQTEISQERSMPMYQR